jgi:hypothetical protein
MHSYARALKTWIINRNKTAAAVLKKKLETAGAAFPLPKHQRQDTKSLDVFRSGYAWIIVRSKE